MAEIKLKRLVQGGRRITAQEIEQIRETVELFPQLAFKELVSTICENMGWYTVAGGLKENACEKLLRKLEGLGMFELPQKLRRGGGKRKVGNLTERTSYSARINCSLQDIAPVRVEVVKDERKELWNEYVQRYHPLGFKQPFGYRMRYFIESERGLLGCLLFSGAALAMGARDLWIGWTDEQRLQRLPWLINLSRHLIFPWVQVPNLSSHVLAQVAGKITEDWLWRWSYEPVLMETFVDPQHHEGSSYKASGWKYLGMTTGEGLVRKGCDYATSPKHIFVKPLCGDFRRVLCSELPQRGGRK